MTRAAVLALALVLVGCVERSYRVTAPPITRPLPVGLVLGTFASNFGEVTFDADDARGGLAMGAVKGTFTYVHPDTNQQVRGHFHGTQRGNVVRLFWQEGYATGHGYLEFDRWGDSYTGQWWNFTRTKTGVWRGRRIDAAPGDV